MSLSKKAKANASSGLLFFGIKIIITLIMNPLLIQYLGSAHFGIWKAIENYLGFASVADGKATQALKWTIANQESSDDVHKKQRAVSSALIVWLFFLPVLSFSIGLLVYFSPELIKNVDAADQDLVILMFFLLGINLILTPLFEIPASILIGTNQGWIINYNNILWAILSALLMYIALILGYGLKQITFVILLVTLLRGFNALLLCKKKVQWFSLSKPQKIETFSFFRFSSWILSWAFISRFLLSSEIFLFGFLIGPETISQYIFTSYVTVTGVSIAAIITSAVTPGLGMLIGKKDYLKSQKIITKLREFSFSFGIFIGIIVLLLNKSFVYLWVGSELFLGWENNLLIVLLMIQLISIRNEAFLIDLSLDLKIKVLLGLGSILLSFTLAIVSYLYISKSIISVLVGILLGRFVLSIAFPFLTNKIIDSRFKLYSSIKFFLAGGFLLSIAAILGQKQILSSWVDLILFGSTEIVFCASLIYIFLLILRIKK